MARNRTRSSAKRKQPAILRMPGLRWVPVPLAALAAVIGVLVMGSFQGQSAQANAHQTGYRAGGLAMSVDEMSWLSNTMTGEGPGQKVPSGFSMPASEMPGIQPVGDDRLRVEVALGNVTTGLQRYSTTDFTLVGQGGKKTWKANSQGHSTFPASANLPPGFQATVDVFFDIPAQQSKHLTLKWSRGGTTVSIPVTIGSGSMQGMQM